MDAEVGYAQWLFTVPKMLRPYFLNHRELLGKLSQAAWDTVAEMIDAATEEPVRPGMVAWPPAPEGWITSAQMATQRARCPLHHGVGPSAGRG